MKKKLTSRAGETLTEVLSCIVMIAMIFSFLAKAVEMAARINRSASRGVASYQADHFEILTEEEEEGAVVDPEPVILSVAIGEEDAPVEVQVYYNGEETKYYYYEYYDSEP